MRRLIIEEPYSRTATWSRRLAWFTLAVMGLTVLLARQGRVEPQTALSLLTVGVGLSGLTALLAVCGFASVWHHGRRGVKRAGFGFTVALVLLAWPAWMAMRSATAPQLNDVTTDLADPPAFSRSQVALAARGGRVPPEPSPAIRERQRISYPDLGPIILDLDPAEAFIVARDALVAQGLRIVEAVPPGGRTGNGRIEAVDQTFLLRFTDDVTIRIRPRADGARVDIRSASRVGSSDLGTNADRIRRLTQAITEQALAD